MILLPIGHEENTVRRLPVVTFGIMAICVVAFVASGQGARESEVDIRLQEKAQRVFEYYMEHPYLELDDRFEIAAYGEADAIESEFREFAEEFGGAQRGASSTDSREQEELDRLAAEALETLGKHTFFRWGLIPADFSLVGLVTHMFLHGGWLHLIGNLLILYLLGPFVEDVWGRPLYGAFYLLSGCVAAVAFIAFNQGSEVPLVGASGAIAGVMGAFLIHYHRTKIKFFYMVGFFWRGTFDAAAWIMLPLWFGEQLMLALWAGSAMSGVAYWAHVGGFAFGLGAALAVRRAGILEKYVQPRLDEACGESLVDRPGLDRALAARAAGDQAAAFDLLSAELRAEPHNADTADLMWETATELDRCREALPLMLRSLQAQIRHGETESVRTMWEKLVEIDPALHAEAPFLLRLVRLQMRLGDREAARRTLRRTLMSAGAAAPPGLSLKIARLGTELDPVIARATLRALLARPDVAAEDRGAAARLLADLPAAKPAVPAGPSDGGGDELPEPIPLALDR